MDKVQMSLETDKLFSALVNALPEIPTVPKNGKAQFGNHRLLDDILDAVKPVFKKHGLFIMPCPVDDGLMVTVGHSSGQSMKFWMRFPENDGTSRQTKQHARGGDITYFKRYMIESIVGIVGDEDTDGHHSHQQQQNHAPKRENSMSQANFVAKEEWKSEPPSPKQLELLQKLFSQSPQHELDMLNQFGDIANMSKHDASEWITRMKGNNR